MSTCAFTASQHHSLDTVTVYHGGPAPITLCGYHASPAWLSAVFTWLTGVRS